MPSHLTPPVRRPDHRSTSSCSPWEVDILELLEARTVAPEVYGPEFDRTAIVDINTDLFPRDEYDLRPREK